VSANTLSVITLCVISLSVITLSAIILGVITKSAITLRVIIPSTFIISHTLCVISNRVIKLGAIITLSDVMLNVVAPKCHYCSLAKSACDIVY
jgi:hypothetical protein